MRKSGFMLITAVFLLLVAGCGRYSATPETPPPTERYTGAPTQLVVALHRSASAYSARHYARLAASSEGDTAYVRIQKKRPDGIVVFDTCITAPLPPGELEVAIPFDIPADQGYEIVAYTFRGNKLLEAGATSQVSAPVSTLTKVSVPLRSPSYELERPGEMFSGGELRQFRARALPRTLDVKVFLGFAPWATNVDYWHPDKDMWDSYTTAKLPAVTQPQKLYYQVAVMKGFELPSDWHYCFAYFPDLGSGAELPYVTVYPYPGWKP